ncbi:MAG: hypothetical protein M3P11_00460 [Actinomycetota bacterium]|nr:hypothetical protein [Actinomycetota bacterium]
MNDLDQGLREMFRRHETDVAGPVFPPPQLVKRVRQRQFRTVSAALIGVFVVIAAGVALSSLVERVDRKVPIAPPSPSIQVAPIGPAPDIGPANVGGVTFSVPQGWYLSTYGVDQAGLIIALTNFAPALTSADPCSGMPSDGILLVVDPASGGHAQPWPVQLEETASSDLSCGSVYLNAAWSSGNQDLGRSATAAIGATATNGDRDILLRAFAALTFENGSRGVALDGLGYCSSADFDAYLVLASGSLGDQLWTLGARPACDQIGLETSYGGNGGMRLGDLAAPDDLSFAEFINDGNTYLLGGVPADVARIVVAPTGAPASDATLYDSGFRADSARVFLAPLDGVRTGTLTTYDSGGSVLRSVRFAPGMDCSDPYACGEPVQPGETITATPPDYSPSWTLREVDGEIRLLGEGGKVLGSVAGTPDPLNVATVTIPGADGVDLVFGVVTPDTSLVLVNDSLGSGSWAAQTAVLTDGRIVFWLLAPQEWSGTAVASFDPACTQLAIVDPLSGDPLTGTPRNGCSDMQGMW